MGARPQQPIPRPPRNCLPRWPPYDRYCQSLHSVEQAEGYVEGQVRSRLLFWLLHVWAQVSFLTWGTSALWSSWATASTTIPRGTLLSASSTTRSATRYTSWVSRRTAVAGRIRQHGPSSVTHSWHRGAVWFRHTSKGWRLTTTIRSARCRRYPLGTALQLKHHGDITKGNSGGPVFGWWGNLPSAIGVITGYGPSPPFSYAAGGAALVNLVKWANAKWT
jgi:hypothetical protein